MSWSDAALLCAVALVAGCGVPCADEVRSLDAPSSTFPATSRVRLTYLDADGQAQIVFQRDDVPVGARASVAVHVPAQTPPLVDPTLQFVTDLRRRRDRYTVHLVPDRWHRARAYASQSGAWAARSTAAVANLLANPRLAPLVHRKPRLPDLDQLPESEKLRAGLEAVDTLDVARAARNAVASRPKRSEFGLGSGATATPFVVYFRAGCAACADARAWLDGAGIAVAYRDVEQKAVREALAFVTRQAGGEDPVVPTLLTPGHVVTGFDAQTYRRVFHVKPPGASESSR